MSSGNGNGGVVDMFTQGTCWWWDESNNNDNEESRLLV